MDLIDLRRLFDYNAWANRETLRAVSRAPGPPPRALRFLGHVVGAESLWLARLRNEPRRIDVWPELDVEACRAELDGLERAWRELLDGLDARGLERPVDYVNSKGEPWRNRLGDILLHAVLHSTYHRGQVAAALREAGVEPAYTDFIHAVRRGLLPGAS